ncbi:hypothetical protein [Hyphomonas sp.]|uniref:hypothetical protein n=1 Tax=Hyphomonas sp. TaxID=87 RepID=UPI00391A5097
MTETSPARRSGRDDLVRHEASQNYEAAKSGGNWMVALAWVSALLWFVALGAAFVGLDGFSLIETQPPALIGAVAIAALIPALLLICAGYMARTSRRASAANALVLEAAARLMAPAREAGTEGITFAEQMKQSATEVDRAMAHALTAMKAMAGELGDERLRLESVSYTAADNARDLAARLTEERHALESLARDLRAQVTAMSDAIPRQAQLMVSAARKASEEVGQADAALEARIASMQRAGDDLAHRLAGLDQLAREAAGRTEDLTFSIGRVEDKLEQSRRTVDAALRASEVAAAAAATTGDALREAVAGAIDGARNANAEISASTRAAAEEAARALAKLRDTGEQAAYALRAAGLAARLESEALDRLAGPFMPAGSAAAAAPLTPPPQRTPISAPEPQPYQMGASQPRAAPPQPAAIPPTPPPQPRPAANRSGMDDDLFEASADAFIARAGFDDDDRPAGRSEPPMVLGRPAPREPENTRPARQAYPPASASYEPEPLRRRETDHSNGRSNGYHGGGNGASGPAPWREIISDISREPGAGLPPADRETVAAAVVERLQGSGIPLGDVYKPRAKRKIADGHRKGDRERRAAAADQAGRQLERVVHRLKGDARLMEMARQFLEFEREDALAALQQTQSTSRNASPRLATFLLLDTALA